ncbi:hypothetical protein [Catalinimonas niigatensis]|uniref:hypothetical protein n=1 Tax=Catalinimonas niigatensis TaxID=1397264 RepID=UPI002665EA6C|nr:hypothetical protein [Catalinimonas niigatensis]WPP52345.1 hypothetical protein PZB72_08120 [Catalinimonas niigatensis]
MLKFYRFFWVFTALAYFVALMLSYAYLPERVGIQTDDEGVVNEFIDRETFFYFGVGIFIVVNLLGSILLSVLNGIPDSSGFYFRSEEFKENITSWFSAFVAIINIFLICAVAYIAIFNNQGASGSFQFNWLIYVAPLFFVINLVWLVMIMIRR